MNYQTNDEDTKNDAAAEKHNPIDESKKNLSRILSDGATDNLAEALDIANEKSPERLSAIKEIVERHADIAVKGTIQGLSDYFDTDKIKSINDAINATRRIMESSLETLKNLYPAVTAYMDRFKAASDIVEKYNQAHFAELISAELPKDQLSIYNLLPFLNISFEEFKKSNTDEKYNSFEFVDLVRLIRDGFNDHDEPVNEMPPEINALIERAFDLQIEFLSSDYKSIDGFITSIYPHISYRKRKLPQLTVSTDKLMTTFFSIDAPARREVEGQVKMIPLKYDNGKGGDTITLYYDYSYNEDFFNNSGISKKFDGYDYFVAAILDNNLDNGISDLSLSKILSDMGFTQNDPQKKRPGIKQLKSLDESLSKGLNTSIRIDDKDIQEAWGNPTGKYHDYEGQVFPIQKVNERSVVDGSITDMRIKILAHTPFWSISKTTNHFTTWDKKVLSLYSGRRTPRYWNIMRYLLNRIGWMRHTVETGRKILYESIYECNGDKTTKDKKHSVDMLYRLLEEVFKPLGYVLKYEEDDSTTPGVILTLPRDQEKKQEYIAEKIGNKSRKKGK